MNISANLLGLDNAATPLGLKAMRELQTLNPAPDTATNAMATFLAINTSNVTLIPFTIISYRVAAGSQDPARPLVAMVLTTLVSTIVAVIVVRWMAQMATIRRDRLPILATSFFGGLTSMQSIIDVLDTVSQWIIPLVMLLIILCAWYKKVPMYESFVTGAKEGFDVAVMIIPYLVAMLFVIKVFLASGIFEDLKAGLGSMMAMVGLGDFTATLDLLPVALDTPIDWQRGSRRHVGNF